jgi:CheY-like chemotaxis protein
MSLALVVDDDPDLLNLYTDLMEEMGLEVVSAQDGVEALKLAVELKPELILTDWQMPRMDGIELCKTLKRSARLDRPLLILHSSEPILEPWCADVCLRKPSSQETFEAVVKAMLESLHDRRTFSPRHHADHASGVSAP